MIRNSQENIDNNVVTYHVRVLDPANMVVEEKRDVPEGDLTDLFYCHKEDYLDMALGYTLEITTASL